VSAPPSTRRSNARGGVAERTVGDHHRTARDDVVDDLVPGEDPDGVGPGLAVHREHDDGLPVGQEVDLVDRREPGLVDGRDAVRRRTAGDDGGGLDERLGQVRVGHVVQGRRSVGGELRHRGIGGRRGAGGGPALGPPRAVAP
jgi:hypothetical protein